MSGFGDVGQALGGFSLLDALTPERIIGDLGRKDDCTADIVELIKTTPHSQLKKLQVVFLSLENFCTESLLELTQSRVRPHRYISTFLIFCKIKVLCRGASNCDKIEALYSTVFVVRFRDVDPSIRSMCVQFISEWAVECEALRRMEFLKYIGWGLNDRSDMVRRKAIKAIVCICRLADDAKRGSESSSHATGRNEVLAFLERYKDRLVEISELDCSTSLQRECRKAILAIYVKRGIFIREQVLRVIGLDDDVNGYKKRVLSMLCPETIWDLDAIHGIARISGPRVFRNLGLDDGAVSSLILNITEFAKRNSSCCGEDHLCFLDVLRELPSSVNPQGFIPLLDTVKDSKENVKRVIQCLLHIDSLVEYSKTTIELLDCICRILLDDWECCNGASMEAHCMEDFVLLLKKLESDFPIRVGEIVSSIKSRHPVAVMRSFDISDSVLSTSQPVLKCYAALWMIAKGNFEWIDSLRFSNGMKHISPDGENQENREESISEAKPCAEKSKPDHYLELADFLIFFHSSGTTFPVHRAVDVPSASRVVFDRLHHFISENFYFEDQEACLHLFKLLSAGMFLDHASLLFRHCTEEQLMYFIENAECIKHIALGFFDSVGGERKLHHLAKPIASKIKKTINATKDRYLLAPLKRLVSRTDLLDSVLMHFVPLLDVNECIVLESLAPKSKFKSLCLKRCKAIKPIKSEENITFI